MMINSGIGLYLEKVIFYLNIERKVWRQRTIDWYEKDDHNETICLHVEATLVLALEELHGQLKKNRKEEKRRMNQEGLNTISKGFENAPKCAKA